VFEGKLPPYDVDAEEAVNGSLLIDGAAIFEINTFLKPEDFYSEPNRLVYEACLALCQRGEAINQITVAQELDRQQKLEPAGGAAYLSHLIAIVPTSLDIEHYARIAYRLSIMRQLIRASGDIANIGYDAGPDVIGSLDQAENILFRLREERSARDFVSIRQVIDRYFDFTAAPETEAVPFIMSGYSKLDEFLGGLQRSDLIIVAGRPSMGKTSLALSIARNAALNQGACVALFSLEMSSETLVQRMVSNEARVDYGRIPFGKHTESEEQRIMEATGKLAEAKIFIDDSPMLRVPEMRANARRLDYENKVDFIIVDYLQLMQGETRRSDNRVQEISHISRSLKALARELNVPVIAVSQLSRAVEWRSSHRPQLSDLRESGSIEQDADIVMFIYRDDYYYKRDDWEIQFPDKAYPEGIANIIIAKHRNGPTGEIDLHFLPRLAKFEDMIESSATETTLL
jgi:replicative DNA helicase